MEHHFNIKLAEEFGILEAVLINHIYYWVEHNAANNKNFYDGCYWTYNSIKAFAELFPYANERQIKYALKKLQEIGIIKTGNYNKVAYDRTLWYAFTKKGLSILQKCGFHWTKLSNGNDEIVQPIPYIKPDKNTNNKPNTIVSPQAKLCAEKLRDKILEIYPNNVGAKKKDCVERWAKDIEKMYRLDDRSWGDIEKAIDWAMNDSFWQKNIWSGANLRKHYDRLEASAREQFMRHGTITVGV